MSFHNVVYDVNIYIYIYILIVTQRDGFRKVLVFIPTHEIKIQQKLSWHRYAFSTFYDHNAVPHFRNKERELNCYIDTLLMVSTVSVLYVTILSYLILEHHCATSRKVAGWIPDWVIGIIHWFNPFGRRMALESTEPLTEVSTRNISWGLKAVGA